MKKMWGYRLVRYIYGLDTGILMRPVGSRTDREILPAVT